MARHFQEFELRSIQPDAAALSKIKDKVSISLQKEGILQVLVSSVFAVKITVSCPYA